MSEPVLLPWSLQIPLRSLYLSSLRPRFLTGTGTTLTACIDAGNYGTQLVQESLRPVSVRRGERLYYTDVDVGKLDSLGHVARWKVMLLTGRESIWVTFRFSVLVMCRSPVRATFSLFDRGALP